MAYLLVKVIQESLCRLREKNEKSRPCNVQRRRSNQASKGRYHLCLLFLSRLIHISQSYVNACGVRKIWSKEFQDLDRPSQQVQRLKAILAELGMGGRPSMERAKEIKEKRALAKELGDWFSGSHDCHIVNRRIVQKRMYALLSKLSWGNLLVRDPRVNRMLMIKRVGMGMMTLPQMRSLQGRIRSVYGLFAFSYLNMHLWSERGSEKYHGVLGRRQ